MTVDHGALVASLRPEADAAGDPGRLAVRVAGWADAMADGGVPPRADLDALCRQIDVRHRLADRYDAEWKAAPDAAVASGATIASAAAALLGAATLAGPADPWRLKAVNSALKALELDPDVPRAPALRAWAFEILDDATGRGVS